MGMGVGSVLSITTATLAAHVQFQAKPMYYVRTDYATIVLVATVQLYIIPNSRLLQRTVLY